MRIDNYPPPSETDYLVDFETYYDKSKGLSVTELGNVAYAKHPDFYAYMVAIWEIAEVPRLVYVGEPENAPWDTIVDGNWWAWNAGFDKSVYDFGLKFTRPIGPVRWDDAAALSVFHNYPRDLAGAMMQYSGAPSQKHVRANAEGKRDRSAFTSDEWLEMLAYCSSDCEGPAKFVYEKAGDWPEEERDIALHTVEISLRGFEVDWDLLQWGSNRLDNCLIETEGKMPWVSEYGMTPLSKKGLSLVCREHGIPAPASIAEGSLELANWISQYEADFDFIKSMKRWQAANRLLKKLAVFKVRKREGDTRIDYGFKYAGAHTLRWSGDSRTGIQTLEKEEVEDVNIRNLIVAPKGKKLCIFDYSQIEPRVLAWLSSDTKFLKLIAQGFSPYEAHAIATMDYKPVEGVKMKSVNPDLYALAKARVLALGYGCGAEKFIVMAKQYCDIDLGLAESKKIVDKFRASNPCITGFWRNLEAKLARAAIRPKGQRDYEFELPSGRRQSYLNIQSRGGSLFAQTQRGGNWVSSYGGKLCENLTQAVARDVLRDGLIRLENLFNSDYWEGHFDILFHVHDEVVLEVPEAFEHDLEDIQTLRETICKTPDWLPGCQIECEIGFSDCYLK